MEVSVFYYYYYFVSEDKEFAKNLTLIIQIEIKFEEKDIKLCCHTVWLETFLAQKLTHDSKKALVFFVFSLCLKLTELPGFVG